MGDNDFTAGDPWGLPIEESEETEIDAPRPDADVPSAAGELDSDLNPEAGLESPDTDDMLGDSPDESVDWVPEPEADSQGGAPDERGWSPLDESQEHLTVGDEAETEETARDGAIPEDTEDSEDTDDEYSFKAPSRTPLSQMIAAAQSVVSSVQSDQPEDAEVAPEPGAPGSDDAYEADESPGETKDEQPVDGPAYAAPDLAGGDEDLPEEPPPWMIVDAGAENESGDGEQEEPEESGDGDEVFSPNEIEASIAELATPEVPAAPFAEDRFEMPGASDAASGEVNIGEVDMDSSPGVYSELHDLADQDEQAEALLQEAAEAFGPIDGPVEEITEDLPDDIDSYADALATELGTPDTTIEPIDEPVEEITEDLPDDIDSYADALATELGTPDTTIEPIDEPVEEITEDLPDDIDSYADALATELGTPDTTIEPIDEPVEEITEDLPDDIDSYADALATELGTPDTTIEPIDEPVEEITEDLPDDIDSYADALATELGTPDTTIDEVAEQPATDDHVSEAELDAALAGLTGVSADEGSEDEVASVEPGEQIDEEEPVTAGWWGTESDDELPAVAEEEPAAEDHQEDTDEVASVEPGEQIDEEEPVTAGWWGTESDDELPAVAEEEPAAEDHQEDTDEVASVEPGEQIDEEEPVTAGWWGTESDDELPAVAEEEPAAEDHQEDTEVLLPPFAVTGIAADDEPQVDDQELASIDVAETPAEPADLIESPVEWGTRYREAHQGWVEDEDGRSTWRPIVTSGESVAGWDIDIYLGLVSGDVSIGTMSEEELASSVAEARADAVRHMLDEGLARGAHAIVGVTFTIQDVAGTVLVGASGVAVTLRTPA